MEVEDKNTDEMNPINSLQNCFKETSAVGFKYTTEGKYRCQQIFWILTLILSFIGVFIY